MVKTPRARHSRTHREPVTIELEPGSVSRLSDSKPDTEAEDEAAGSHEAAAEADTERPEIETAVADIGDTPRESSAAAPGAAETAAEEPVMTSETPDEAAGPNGGDHSGSGGSSTPPPARRGGFAAALLAGIIGGVVALALGGALQWAGVLPVPAGRGADARMAAVRSLGDDLDALKKRVDAQPAGGIDAATLKQTLAPLAKRIDQLSGELEHVKVSAADAKSAAETGEQGSGAAQKAIEARLSKLEEDMARASTAGASSAAVEALNGRVAALENAVRNTDQGIAGANERLGKIEQTIAALEKKADANAGDNRATAAIAASALKTAIDSGASFSAELDTFAAVAPDAREIGELRKLAADGVATKAQLAAGVGTVAQAMADAIRPSTGESGVVDRLLASARSLVKVRPVGTPEGEGAAARIARFEAAVRGGDLQGAASEYDALPEAAKAAGADFMTRLGQRLAADELARKALDGVLKTG